MEAVELLAAGVVLVIVVGIGTVVHELAHAITLHALGVTYEIRWLPERDGTGLRSVTGAWATVTPEAARDHAPWRIRVAALMPLTLALPIPLVLAGITPDPLAAGDPALTTATIGWLACALPSPQDFSMVWRPEQVIGRSDT